MSWNRRKFYSNKKKVSELRSIFEDSVVAKLIFRQKQFKYEPFSLEYVQPSKPRKYTPDLELPNGILVEIKGFLTTEDRNKMVWVKQQNPDKDIRFVFQRSSNKIYKGSKTTYGDWATANGFIWASGEIPLTWFDEDLKGKK